MELFETCPVCSRVSEVKTYRRGTFLSVHQKCHHCNFSKKWKSQPVMGSTPVGNIQLSAAIYFTGSSYFKLQKVFQAMHLQSMSYKAFQKLSDSYLQPAVIHQWQQYQEEELQILSQKTVKIGGDMRADSPGHSAKYGSYSLMNLENNNIIDIQLVQSNEVGGSHNMEKEGLTRSLQLLESKGVAVDYIVTDHHPQIHSFLQEKKITHYYDVWRLEKSISKKLAKVAKDKDCEVVKKWQCGISNHAYWCATSSSSGPEKVAKWTSMVNHMQDIHVHENPLFPRCQHPVRQSTDRKKWFQPGSKALSRVEKILTNRRVLMDVARLSSQCQTSTQEAFHSVVLRFTPRNVFFPFIGRLCRLYLAAMHFNENSSRIQARKTTGKRRYAIHFPKAKKGGHTVKPVESPPTQCYVHNLIADVFEEIVPHPQPYLEKIKKIQLTCHRTYTILH
uniref:Zgc:123060 n=1 Tax=Iconisemion striatum TaxID=60296 RepID=A0A1A7YS46_9TELE